MATKHIFRGDNIDDLIIARKLDQHPDLLPKLMKEHRLETLLGELAEKAIVPLMPLVTSRVLNFIEASVRGDMSVAERRVGIAIAVLISCVDATGETSGGISMSISTLIPVCLALRKDYSKFLVKTVFTEAELLQIQRGVMAFRMHCPTANTFKHVRTLMFLRDACLAWIGTGDQAVRDFILFRDSQSRIQFAKGATDYDVKRILVYLVDVSQILRQLKGSYGASSLTQWGTARNFEHNYAAQIKAMTKSVYGDAL